MSCWFCYGKPEDVPGNKFLLSDIPICPGHRAMHQASIDAYERDHPNGGHTETCGCMTETELWAALGAT